MKKSLLFLGLLMLVLPMKAQDFQEYKDKQKQEMERYRGSMKRDYDEYRRQANEDYARFMRERWEEFQAMKGVPVPDIPEPPQPYEREKDIPVPELPIKFDKIVAIPTSPQPVKPLERPASPVIPAVSRLPEVEFVFYGTKLSVHMDNNLKIKLKDISENSVADAWEQLASEPSIELLDEFLTLRDELSLGDWAYYCMLRDFSEQCFGKDANEAVVMRTYLMAQSGFKVRISRKNTHLIVLLPFDGMIYETSYLSFSGERFYDVDGSKEEKGATYYTYNRSLTDNDRVLSLRMPAAPKLAFKSAGERTFTSKKYPEISVSLSANKNLVDFYNGYPQCMWTNYSWAGLSEEVKAKLYPALRKGIEGKSQIEAANRIINFVQTAFGYQTDQQQFGYERSLFADETFYYPYSDCEDRSILFSILVRDLLGLEVVLLHYPDHLATAVHYTEELNGTFLTLDEKKYYVSDPTYINANVGDCMPRYTKTRPEILKL